MTGPGPFAARFGLWFRPSFYGAWTLAAYNPAAGLMAYMDVTDEALADLGPAVLLAVSRRLFARVGRGPGTEWTITDTLRDSYEPGLDAETPA